MQAYGRSALVERVMEPVGAEGTDARGNALPAHRWTEVGGGAVPAPAAVVPAGSAQPRSRPAVQRTPAARPFDRAQLDALLATEAEQRAVAEGGEERAPTLRRP